MMASETVLEAGRALDAQIAEKVMGLKPCTDPVGRCEAAHMDPCQCWGDGAGGSDLELYSIDIAAAWRVLDEMVWRVGTANIRLDMEDYGRGAGTSPNGAERAVWVTIGDCTAFGPAPLAICRAALAAVMPQPATDAPH